MIRPTTPGQICIQNTGPRSRVTGPKVTGPRLLVSSYKHQVTCKENIFDEERTEFRQTYLKYEVYKKCKMTFKRY